MSIKPHKPHPRSKFSVAEDIILCRLVVQFGTSSWEIFPQWLPGRNARQCRERWIKYLSPSNRFEPFLPEEDQLLRSLYAKYGARWVKISQFFQRRTDIQVKNRWLVLSRRDSKASRDGNIQMDTDVGKVGETLDPSTQTENNTELWNEIDNIHPVDLFASHNLLTVNEA